MVPFDAAADKSVMLIFCRMNCHKDLLVYDRCKLFIFFLYNLCFQTKRQKDKKVLVSLSLHYFILFSFLFVCLLTKIHLLVGFLLTFFFRASGIV